jgi:hypothetical protein
MTAYDQGANETGTPGTRAPGTRATNEGKGEDRDFADYAALERRYDGPIPIDALDRLRFGSGLMAEMARIEDSIAFFRQEIVRMRRSAKRWFERGNIEMARQNITDSRLYLGEWRTLRRRLGDLRAEARDKDRARGERAQLLNAKRVLDLIGKAAD